MRTANGNLFSVFLLKVRQPGARKREGLIEKAVPQGLYLSFTLSYVSLYQTKQVVGFSFYHNMLCVLLMDRKICT